MAKHVILRTAGILALVGAGGVWAHDDQARPGEMRYQGHDTARAVCMSIVDDDVEGLQYALRRGKSSHLERTHLAYECNSMRLDEFAFTMDADSVSDYLAPKFGREGVVTVEQVGSINN